jgi:hypothetical protein
MIAGCQQGFMLSSIPGEYRKYVVEHWYDKSENLVTIRIDESFRGTDGDCARAAMLFHAICKQGYTLYVLPYRTGGWVPSRINPMTIEWTQQLIESDP